MAKNDVSYICLRAGFFYVFILYRFDEIFLNIWMNYRNATANTNFFLWRENRGNCERKIEFLLILRNASDSFFFFSFFLSSFSRRRTRRYDDSFSFSSDGYLPEFTKRDFEPVFLARKLDLNYFWAEVDVTNFFFLQIKHHNWPPIFLLEGQEIVPQTVPMLLLQPEIQKKNKSKLWNVTYYVLLHNFTIPLCY